MKIINTFCTVITMKTSRSISTIQSYSELKELISKNKIARVYLFIGNGPKNQYPDMSTVKSNLKEFFKTSNLRWERRIPESGIFFFKFKTFELAIFVVLQMITTLWWNKGTLWSNYKILCKMADIWLRWGPQIAPHLTFFVRFEVRILNFLFCEEWGEVPQFHCEVQEKRDSSLFLN